MRIEPSLPFGDAPCPACGTLLWFANLPSRTVFFRHEDSRPVQLRAAELVARQLDVPAEDVLSDPNFFRRLMLDSLDMVELAVELEDELKDELIG
jgi:acyl carrier protein